MPKIINKLDRVNVRSVANTLSLILYTWDNDKNTGTPYYKAIIDLVKNGYTILTTWGEFDRNVPTTVFVWHPQGESIYSLVQAS